MTYDDFIEKYKPITNYIDDNASFNGWMFETYGDELEAVKISHPNKVWTIVEGDDGEFYVSNGYHYVNRQGYFITEVPYEDDEMFDILIG